MSNTCYIVFLFCLSSHVCPMLSVTLDCPFLMAPSLSSNVYMIFVYQSLSPHLLYHVNLVLLFSSSVNIFFFLVGIALLTWDFFGGPMEYKQNVFVTKCWSAYDSRCRGGANFFALLHFKGHTFLFKSLCMLYWQDNICLFLSSPREKSATYFSVYCTCKQVVTNIHV